MPKVQLELDSLIDLKQPGIERLRLTPKQINNGEIRCQFHRDFNLLPKDEKFLNDSCLQWETYIDNSRRWLIIKNYPIPEGYTSQSVELAIEMPSSYPAAELDMFYCNPHLALSNGRQIPQTQVTETIKNLIYQRWSRHRDPNTWSPQNDSIVTHLALVEESIAREVNP